MNIDILLCINEIFIFGAGTLIASVNKYNASHNITYHIFAPTAQIKKIQNELDKRFSNNTHHSYIYYTYDEIPAFQMLRTKMNERMAIQCVRIIAPRICRTTTDHLIYIDADFICLKNIHELAELDFHQNILAVVPDDPTLSTPRKVGDKTLYKYFCSGLIVFNQSKWLSSDLEKKCIEYAITKTPILPDQDTLNYVCDGVCEMLEQRFHGKWDISDYTVLLHYLGAKPWFPWHFNTNLALVNLFRAHAKLFEPNVTRWISFKDSRKPYINVSKNRKGLKWLSKLMFKKGYYFASVYFYFKHISVKVTQKGILGTLLMKSNTRS